MNRYRFYRGSDVYIVTARNEQEAKAKMGILHPRVYWDLCELDTPQNFVHVAEVIEPAQLMDDQ